MVWRPTRRATALVAGNVAVIALAGAAFAGVFSSGGAHHPKRPSAGASTTPGLRPHTQWRLVKEWTFRKPSDLAEWGTYIGSDHGYGHSELQYYTRSNVWTSPSGLVMQAAKIGAKKYHCYYGPCQYTAARLSTQGRYSHEYGLIEARIKLPAGKGLWPAFWMEGTDTSAPWPSYGEFDVVESNNAHNELVQGFAHGTDVFQGVLTRLHQPVAAGYHTYGMYWTPTGVTWLVDGRAYGHLTPEQARRFRHPFFFILQFAVGGTWPGTPPASTHFPARMIVDWVKIFRGVFRKA
jgi:beta-glucanase (GH16 family)